MNSTAQDVPFESPLQNRSDPFAGLELPPHAKRVKLLGVYYLHIQTQDGGDLYVTRFGLRHLEHLKLQNWREDGWFKEHRERLKGTSTVYRVPSKVVKGRSVDLVVKWSRVGEDVPLDTFTFSKFENAEFNSPFEEFSLAIEMRERKVGPRIRTNKPLAIYVPPQQLKLWQTGRSRSKMERKKAKNRDVELDIARQYILIYEWVKGLSSDEALLPMIPDEKKRIKELKKLTEMAQKDLEANGFMVADHKPAHVIVRPQPDGSSLKMRGGKPVYAMIDFELLFRTPEYAQQVQEARRADYLAHQRNRFEDKAFTEQYAHLRPSNIMGIDYVWGRAESTHGMLWVVGRNPELFDYFLPERWRHTQRVRLSETAETYHTESKDHVKLVWKVSRVGETPEIRRPSTQSNAVAARGYNSPFEEFALAIELASKGFSTVYPRAIYRTGHESTRAQEYVKDTSRFEDHAALVTPEGKPVLSRECNYITIWGFWQGRIGSKDASTIPPRTGISLARAVEEKLVTEDTVDQLLEQMAEHLKQAGYLADLKRSHYLLSITPERTIILDKEGLPEVTICNFELITPMG